MKKLKRKIISAITAFAFICSMGINTAQAATRLTTAHLYHWAKTANTVRLTQFQRYINLPDKNNNTALCLAQQAKNRNAYKLLLEYGASTDVECHDDDDPICAIVAGDKVKVSPLGWAVLGAGALVGAYIALDDDGGSKTPEPENQCSPDNGEYPSLNACETAHPYYKCEKNENNCYVQGGPKDCPTGYSIAYQKVEDCGTLGGWSFSTNGQSGDNICGKCTKKQCPTGSTSCTPAEDGYTLTSTENGTYAGNDACLTCTYACNETTHTTDCPAGKDCTLVTKHGITCQTNPVCKEGYNYTDEATCEAGGYICTESAPGSGCWKQTGSNECPTGYSTTYPDVASCGQEGGWDYDYIPVGDNICGKCTAKTCETGSTSCTPAEDGYTLTSTENGTYAGNDACLTCTYACNETTHTTDCPAGKDCTPVTKHGITCQINPVCKEGYNFNNETDCKAGGYICTESAPGSGCWKQTGSNECPTGYSTTYPDVASCGTLGGWDYDSKTVGDNICGKCTAKQCPQNSSTEYTSADNCPVADAGAKASSTSPTGSFNGNDQCYTCSYACDETTTYRDKSVCENNGNYVCSETNPNGLTCWKRTADGDCPANTSETPCEQAKPGYVLDETFTTVGASKKCYTCNYSCDTDNDWTTTQPHAGRDFDNVTMPNGDVCYKDTGCPVGYDYTSEATCEAGGYVCSESATGSGCWKQDNPASCPAGEYTTCPTDYPTGITFASSTPSGSMSGEDNCLQCHYKCDTTKGYQSANCTISDTGFTTSNNTNVTYSKDYDETVTCHTCSYTCANGYITEAQKVSGREYTEYTSALTSLKCYKDAGCPTGSYTSEDLCLTHNIGYTCKENVSGSGCWIKDTPAECPTNTYTNASFCPTYETLDASLGSEIKGYNGTNTCHSCEYQCKSSYYDDSAECTAGGYNCTPITNNGITCYNRTGSSTCPAGYSTDYQNESDCVTEFGGNASGWRISTSGQSGGQACGKCEPNDCPSGSSTDTCDDFEFTNPTSNTVGYSGNSACYTCSYSCDENSYHYAQSSTCESKHTGFDCTSTTVDPQTTCFIIDDCERDYLPSCNNGSFYTATASQTYSHPVTGNTCNTCEYACDTSKGYSTTQPAEGTIIEETMPNGVKCYTSTACPIEYPYTKAQCEANGHGCIASTDAPNCYKPTSCPTNPYTYEEGKESCNNTSGWTYYSENLGSFICGYCEKENCPANEFTSCSQADTGAKLTQTPTANYEGDTQCNTCTYACDEETTYRDKSVCESNGNYVCSETNPNGLTCWERTADGACPTGTSETQCTPANRGYTLKETFTTVGDSKKCYSCNYTCDTTNGWSTTEPHAGHDKDDVTMPNSTVCYLDKGCPINTYDNEQLCLNANTGYTCKENVSGSGCWIKDTPADCPTNTYINASFCPTYETLDASLGTEIKGYNGTNTCHSCEYQCKSSYYDDSAECTAGGYNCTPITNNGITCYDRTGNSTCPAGYSTDYQNESDCVTEFGGNTSGWTISTDGQSGGQTCGKCDAVPCPSSYPETYTDVNSCPTKGAQGYTLYTSSGIYSGSQLCTKCVARTCSDYDQYSSTEYTTESKCPPKANLTADAVSPVNDAAYAGEDICNICRYTCDDTNTFVDEDTCVDRKGSCVLQSFNDGFGNNVECYVYSACPTDYPYAEDTCTDGGYTCTESTSNPGCWKRTGSEACRAGYTEGLLDCSGKKYQNGWNYTSETVGFKTCGKCTPIESCEVAEPGSVSSVSQCQSIPNLNTSLSSEAVAYAGDTACFNCTYSCDENNHYYDDPTECNSKETGFTCSSTTVGSNTCYTPTGCATDYTSTACSSDSEAYKATTTFDKTVNSTHCYQCEYSCDTAKGWTETEPNGGHSFSKVTMPNGTSCYLDRGCPTDTFTSEESCEAGGWICSENFPNSGCWKQDEPATCPTTEAKTCSPAKTGFTLQQTETENFSGGEKCYTCSYSCATGYYNDEDTCLDDNAGYTCSSTSQTNSDGTAKTCWYKSDNASCPDGYSTAYQKVEDCGTTGADGWIFESDGQSGEQVCGKCTAKTCSEYDNISSTAYSTQTDCPIDTDDETMAISVTTVGYSGNSACNVCNYDCNKDYKYYKTEDNCINNEILVPTSAIPDGCAVTTVTTPNNTNLQCWTLTTCPDGYTLREYECNYAGFTCEEHPTVKECYKPTSCPAGYELNRADCSDKKHPSGWSYESAGYGGLITCGKCVEKTCNTGFTAGKIGNSCGNSGVNGWTVAQDTVTPYAGDKACNQCVAKECPIDTVVGGCPNVTGLDYEQTNSSSMNGDDNCYACQYWCDETQGYYDLYDIDTPVAVNITTPFGETITCYTTDDHSATDTIVNTGSTSVSGNKQSVLNKGNITANNQVYYGIVTTSGHVVNDTLGQIHVTNTNHSIGIDTSTGNVTNKGRIYSTSNQPVGIQSNGEFVNNKGAIYVTGNNIGKATGIQAGDSTTVYNDSLIDVKNASGDSYGVNGIQSNRVINNGTIKATSTSGNAYGIYTGGGHVENYGDITVSGKNAYGIYASGTGNTIINADYASITVTGTNNAYGIYFDTSSSTNLVANHGTIIVNGTNVGNAGIYLNGATLANVGDVVFEVETANLDDLGGTVTLEKGGTYTAKTLEGTLVAGTSLVKGSNQDTFIAEDSLKVDNTDNLNIKSGTALFEASIVENNTTGNKSVMMKRYGFNKFTPNKSIGDYLEEQHSANKITDLYDKMVNKDSDTGISEAIAKDLGYDIMPNFADENFTVLKSLNRNISETILTPTNEVNRVTAGYDNINIETKDKGLLSGSDLSSNTMYTFGDKRLDNKNRLGLGLSLTKISSNYEKGGSRDLEVISIFMPYMHKFSEKLRLSSILSFGMGFGEYDRGSDDYESDINDIFYGLTNELRYSMDLNGFAELEPALMLNAIGYTEDGFDEGNGENALESKKTHNLSVEAGVGLFLKKQFNTPKHGRLTMRVGGAYYRELASPFDDIKARHKNGTGAWYRINDYADLYDEDRALLEATINYDYKALGLYLKYNRLFQRNDPQLLDLGVKYNF